MTDLSDKADELNKEVVDTFNHDKYDPSHEKDVVIDIFAGEVPHSELAEKAVDLEFEHIDGPGTLYQLEETVEHVIEEWFDDSVPSEVSEDVKMSLIKRHRDKIQDKAEVKFQDRKYS